VRRCWGRRSGRCSRSRRVCFPRPSRPPGTRSNRSSTAGLTELHDWVSASGFGFCPASSQVGEAFLESGNLAEPGVVAGLNEAGFGVGGHLLDAFRAERVDAEEAATGAGVFVDAGGAVGAEAAAEGDHAEQEVLFELGSVVAGGGALLGAVAQRPAAFDEGFVGGDEVLGDTVSSDVRYRNGPNTSVEHGGLARQVWRSGVLSSAAGVYPSNSQKPYRLSFVATSCQSAPQHRVTSRWK
jgi:hypothetical protein